MNDKINDALDALLSSNSAKFDELVADILQDKVAAAVEAKRSEYAQSAFASTEELDDEEIDETSEEAGEVDDSTEAQG